MVSVRVLDAAQVKQLLAPDRLRTRLEEAMEGLSAGRADVPPRVAARAPNGLLAAMPGYLDGVGLPARAPPIAPARPHPQQQFDMDSAASAA